MLSARKISFRLSADSSTVVTVSLPSLELGEEYIVMRNSCTSSMLISIVCNLLRLCLNSVKNFPFIFRMLRVAMTADGFSEVVADGVPVSVHDNLR